MNLGVVITMYDEFSLVLESIEKIRLIYKNATIVTIQSKTLTKNPLLKKIISHSDIYKQLPNLGKKYDRYELPSQAICRNISVGISQLYKTRRELDIIVVFTGDTLITDPTNFLRRSIDIKKHQWIAMVSQAIGQNFHASGDDPAHGKSQGRFQSKETTDFMPQLFFIDGEFANKTHVFSNIPITNKFTSEQCLGDELVRAIDGQKKIFKKMVGVLNAKSPKAAYSYSDGITYHAKTNGLPSR